MYSAANDPQTANDPQIGPQMIPDVNRKWSRRKTTDGMDFGFLDFSIFSIFLFFFHQLKDKLDQIKEKIYWQRKL